MNKNIRIIRSEVRSLGIEPRGHVVLTAERLEGHDVEELARVAYRLGLSFEARCGDDKLIEKYAGLWNCRERVAAEKKP